MQRIIGLLLVLGVAAAVDASAQDQTAPPTHGQALPDDTAAAVRVALKFARHELVSANKHLSIDLAGVELVHRWSDLQANAFRAALLEDGVTSFHMDICDSRKRSCRLDAASEVISVGTPQPRGDTIAVVIQVTRLNPAARMPYSLRGHEYALVKRNARWVVVRSELVLVS